jgi:hypothetical protein
VEIEDGAVMLSASHKVCSGLAARWVKQVPDTTTRSKVSIEQAKEFLRSAPEISIFGVCCVMVDELRCFERAFKKGELTPKAFWDKSNAVVGQLSETATATERFGIVLPVLAHGEFSSYFWRWFNWWDDYFQTLTPRQVSELEALARQRLPEAERFRPAGHWSGYRSTPAFTIEEIDP